jgi:hypothetical protein
MPFRPTPGSRLAYGVSQNVRSERPEGAHLCRSATDDNGAEPVFEVTLLGRSRMVQGLSITRNERPAGGTFGAVGEVPSARWLRTLGAEG